MPSALIPNEPGAFSALGLALAGDATECSEAVHEPWDRRAHARLARLAAELRRRALRGCAGRAAARVEAHVRYRGQGAALRLPFGGDLAVRFAAEHARRYGFTMPAAVEVVRLTARAEAVARTVPPQRATHRGAAVPRRRRPPIGGEALPVLSRADLRGVARGPLIVEEPTATTVVPLGWEVRVTRFALLLRRRAKS
jgi:N-methylhydantoinase A